MAERTAALRTAPGQVALRPVADGDRPFLRAVYGATRADELARVDWTEAGKQAFVDHQFEAQDRFYREHYPEATFDVVLVDGRPAGRLYVDRWPDEIRIIDVALLPHHRNAGTGTALLRGVMEEAAASGRKVSIHVERFNRALRLYARLGFVPVADKGVYLMLEWAPGGPHASGDDGLVAAVSAGGRDEVGGSARGFRMEDAAGEGGEGPRSEALEHERSG